MASRIASIARTQRGSVISKRSNMKISERLICPALSVLNARVTMARIPVSHDVIMTWSDDPSGAQAYPTADLSRDLSHRPEQETVFVYSTARLYSLTKGWIDTPPLRRIALIPGANDTFWFQIAESGPTWDLYDWGLMRADGSWAIPPGIMDIFVLQDGLTLALDPPEGKRIAHDSYFGWELDANTLGFESVIDAEGQAVGPKPDDTGATRDGRPLVKQGGVWFLLSDGVLVPYDGEPERFSFRGPSIGDRRFDTFNVASTCKGGLIHFSEPQSATTAEGARALLWGLKDSRGRVMVPAIYPVITCPEHGVAMVPDTDSHLWCPVGRGPQAERPSNCRRGLWDGVIRENYGYSDKPRDPDPFRASVLVWQDKLLRQVYPGLDFGKPED